VAGKNVADVLDMTASQVLAHFDPADARDYVLGRALQPLVDVGLGYLRLGQPLSTLSGGETQRLKLARALAEVEAGTLLLLDEPSAGLHPGEIGILSRCFADLCARGVSILIVEHELALIADADWVIELGPGGGPAGGCVVFNGAATELARADTLTGRALREEQARRKSAAAQAKRQKVPAALALAASAPTALEVRGARENNLRDVSVRVSRNALTIVTGPSGSGKSSLAFDVIAAEGQRRFMDTLSPYARQFLPMLPRPAVDEVTDIEPTIALEQRTTRPGPNSTVATVTEVGHFLRLMFAKLGDVDSPS
jgi:excinuclease ABC subunit A